MNLLAELVPAIREIRAPLTGGYLWLLTAWLNFGDRIPEPTTIDRDTFWYQIQRLDGFFGTAGIVVAMSVLAYLIGSLVGELISTALSLGGVDLNELERSSDAIPETKYAVASAIRLHAEAELRWHVALPLAAIAASVVPDNQVLAGTTLAMALVLAAHGYLLRRRWLGRADVAQSIVEHRQAEMTEELRKANRAEIRLSVGPGAGESSRTLHLGNSSTVSARDINILQLGYDQPPNYVASNYLPIEELRSHDSARLPIDLSLADPAKDRVRLVWTDPAGYWEEVRTISFA